MSTRKQQQRQLKEQRKQREKQRAEDREQRRLEKAFNANGDQHPGWMKELLDNDDMLESLNQYEIDFIRGLINRQWMLSNLSDAEVHDKKYWFEAMRYKITGSFPPNESQMQGAVRAFMFDDRSEALTSLTAEERIAIDQIVKTFQTEVSRSKEGFERQQMNTNIARTEKEETEGDDGGGLSLFG